MKASKRGKLQKKQKLLLEMKVLKARQFIHLKQHPKNSVSKSFPPIDFLDWNN